MPDSNPDETEEERKRRLALAGGEDSQKPAVQPPPPRSTPDLQAGASGTAPATAPLADAIT